MSSNGKRTLRCGLSMMTPSWLGIRQLVARAVVCCQTRSGSLRVEKSLELYKGNQS